MTKTINIKNVFNYAISKKESKAPYLIAYIVANFFLLIILLRDYLAFRALNLPLSALYNLNFAALIQVQNTWVNILSFVPFIYFFAFLPIIKVGNPWLGLRSIRGVDNQKYDCFKLTQFYQPILGFYILLRIFLLVLMLALFGRIPYLFDWLVMVVLLPFCTFTYLQMTDGNSFVKSYRFGFIAYIKNFFKVLLFLLVITALNIFALLSIVGWIWIAPIMSRAWAALYQAILDNEK